MIGSTLAVHANLCGYLVDRVVVHFLASIFQVSHELAVGVVFQVGLPRAAMDWRLSKTC